MRKRRTRQSFRSRQSLLRPLIRTCSFSPTGRMVPLNSLGCSTSDCPDSLVWMVRLRITHRCPRRLGTRCEPSYCSGRSRCVVTTTALAAGVNLPTTHVIVRDLTFQGTDPLPVDQLVQMAGRAGRGDKRGHAFFIHRTNDAWKIERLLSELKEPPFPKLSSALRGVGGRSKPRDRERCIPRAASVILSLLARRDAAMSETEIENFFNRSLVGNAFPARFTRRFIGCVTRGESWPIARRRVALRQRV